VTSWSVLGLEWTGIPFLSFLEHVKPKKNWKCLMQLGLDGYTVNAAREDVEREDVFIAYECNGVPLSQEHGCIRLLIPGLYGWKGCKFLGGLEFLEEEQKGFWEERGAHIRGRVEFEERWAEDKARDITDIKVLLQQTNRKSLDLSNLGLEEIPEEVFSMKKLQELRLENNKLKILPSRIGELTSLSRIVLSQNCLTSLPPEIGQLENLVELFLINNQLQQICPELANCSNLVSLWLDNNRIKEVPRELAKLTNLGALSLDNNLIEEMPKELAYLVELRSFSFRKNPVKWVPAEYYQLQALAVGWIGFDKVENIPQEIVDEGPPAILNELKRQWQQNCKL